MLLSARYSREISKLSLFIMFCLMLALLEPIDAKLI